MPLNEWIASYQQSITALQERRAALMLEKDNVHGQAYLALLRRIRALYEEELDTLEALRQLSRCRRRYEAKEAPRAAGDVPSSPARPRSR